MELVGYLKIIIICARVVSTHQYQAGLPARAHLNCMPPEADRKSNPMSLYDIQMPASAEEKSKTGVESF
jgi:hypothetical protein